MLTWQNLSTKTGNHTNLPAKFVVDASIAVKWFSEESDTKEARLVLQSIYQGQALPVSPSLIIYEVANALWKGKKQDSQRVVGAVREVFSSPIDFFDLDLSLAEKSIEFMVKYDLSFYDSIYAGLSAMLDIPLLTANVKHYGKVKEIKIFTLK